MIIDLHVDSDITKAQTLPSIFYTSEEYFKRARSHIFSNAWHFAIDLELPRASDNISPYELLPNFIDEPILFIRNQTGSISALSNVCTHRGSLLTSSPKRSQKIICPYHGRRFLLDGTCEHMPEFTDVAGFPSVCDHLQAFETRQWYQFLFVSNKPKYGIDNVIKELMLRVGFLPVDRFKFHVESTKTHYVQAHWALYCDNYLEGFHIPFVHPGLNQIIDYETYETVLLDDIILQIGYARNGEACFDLPAGHIDYGKPVAAYYFFIFPNLMLNFYPWGLSVNIVEPKEIAKTEVRFITYVHDWDKFNAGASELTDKVEEEDEQIVEAVQKGMNSHVYNRGRYSPSREQGVHHFHRLICQRMND